MLAGALARDRPRQRLSDARAVLAYAREVGRVLTPEAAAGPPAGPPLREPRKRLTPHKKGPRAKPGPVER